MIRILIADDHALMREGLRQLFTLCPDFYVAAEAANNVQLFEALNIGNIDLILLDMHMPGISGAGLVSQVHARYQNIPILVLSMHNELQIARHALGVGASGYITKDSDPETLVKAIRTVASGKRFIDPELIELMALESNKHDKYLPHEQLSDRELQILLLLIQGISINTIADELSISNKTVSTHKARLMQKLNFRNNAKLIRYGIGHRLAI
jgi:DNA-binding NarL/FixJ family response regulator